MAEITTQQFPTATSVTGTDTVLMNVSNATRKVALDDLYDIMNTNNVKYYNSSANMNCDNLPVGDALCQAGSGLNYPDASGFWYVHSFSYTRSSGVITNGYQVAVKYNDATYKHYYRKCTSGTWSTWENTRRPLISAITPISTTNYTHTTANAWECTGLSFTIPSNHRYIARILQNWSNGEPKGIALSTSSTVPSYFQFCKESVSNPVLQMTEYLGPATYYIFTKRSGAAGYSNAYTVEAIDLYFG